MLMSLLATMILPGLAFWKFIEVHVCFFSCRMLSLSSFWFRGSSWVCCLLFILLSSGVDCFDLASDATSFCQKRTSIAVQLVIWERSLYLAFRRHSFCRFFQDITASKSVFISISPSWLRSVLLITIFFVKIEGAVESLSREILSIQAKGDKEAAGLLL